MVSPSLASLLDLCCIRISYLLWIRRIEANVYYQLDIVLDDARELPLPEKLQSLVVKHVNPTGGRLLSLLKLWLSKLPFDFPQKQQIGKMLFDCLVLNADGLINQRRTVQSLLGNKVLHNVLAFRLACINFLETEVLKLWILVKEHFLNTIVSECNEPGVFQWYINERGLIQEDHEDFVMVTKEPSEVLFWIGYCLSKENAVDIREVPHFMGSEVDWYEYALDCAINSGNVACFDYFKKFHDGPLEYDYVNTIKRILRSKGGIYQHSSFIFHLMLLNFQEKSELFRELPQEMVNQFFLWPLSQTFLQNTEEIWNLLPDEHKHWVLSEIHKFLIFETVLLYNDYMYSISRGSLAYCVEHLLGLWHALWNLSEDSCKEAFLYSYIFPDFEREYVFPSKFEASGLEQKLLSLCLSNRDVLLELYRKETLLESMRSVVAKYMPEDLEYIDGTCISTWAIPYRFELEKARMVYYHSRDEGCTVNEKHLGFIKTVLFLSY